MEEAVKGAETAGAETEAETGVVAKVVATAVAATVAVTVGAAMEEAARASMPANKSSSLQYSGFDLAPATPGSQIRQRRPGS